MHVPARTAPASVLRPVLALAVLASLLTACSTRHCAQYWYLVYQNDSAASYGQERPYDAEALSSADVCDDSEKVQNPN